MPEHAEHHSRNRTALRRLAGGCWRVMVLIALPVLLATCQFQAKEPGGPADRITFAYPDLPMSALFMVSQAKGLFAAEGVEVVLQRHPFGKPALRSVLDGKADMAIAGDTPIMFAAAAGEKVRLLAMISTAEKSEAVVTRRDRGISVPEELKGKRIGVTLGTTGEFYLDSLLSTRGIGRQEVTLVDLTQDRMATALAQGEVDAVTVWQPVLTQLRAALGDRGVAFYDETIYSEIMCIATREDIVQSRPEAVRKVMRALVNGEAFLRNHPDEARRLVADFIKLDQALMDEIWNIYDFRVTLSQALLASLESQTAWARKTGRIGVAAKLNYLDYIYSEGLQSVKPEAVRLIR